MTVHLGAPVGMRDRLVQVTNFSADQDTIISLLATIPVAQGGQRERWGVQPLSGPDGNCPQPVADAIWDFQVFWEAAGLLQVVDGVVEPDRSTWKRLVALAEASPMVVLVDVVVKFQGSLHVATPLTPNEVFPDALLGFYQTKTGRRLERIGQRTVTIRDASAQLIANYVATIKGLDSQGRGEVLIYGSSSGGRNAVDLAAALRAERIPVRWVAALDAAYFPDESVTAPDNLFGEPTVVPRFRPALPVTATTAESYFQRVGNHSTMTLHGLMFTSGMGGKEVHGSLEGFTDRDLTDVVRALLPTGDDDAHIRLTQAATPLLQAAFAAVLNAL